MAYCYTTALQMAFAHNGMLMLTVKHWLWSPKQQQGTSHLFPRYDWRVCVFVCVSTCIRVCVCVFELGLITLYLCLLKRVCKYSHAEIIIH